MNYKLRTVLAAILVAAMLFALPGDLGILAFAEETEEFPENSICLQEDDTLGADEPQEGDQTDMFLMDIPEGEPEEESADALSIPLDGEEETLGTDDDEEVFPDDGITGPSGEDDTLGTGDDDTLGASPSVTASKTSITMKAGETATVTMSVSGFSGSVYLSYSTNNTKSYSGSWGSWNRLKIPLRIKANAAGEGSVTVYMKSASNNRVLDSVKIKVKVQPAKNPGITLSSSSVNIAKGKSQKINVTVKDYTGACYLKYSNSNGTAVGCSWGSWSGWTIPLTVSAKNSGSSVITVYLYSTAGRQLAKATISVSVYTPVNPKITLSTTSVSLKVGNSTSVKVTPSGYSGECYISYSQSNSKAYKCTWGSWSNGSIPLTITGLNEGSGSITVYLKSKNGTVLASSTISSVKITAVKKPALSASKSSVSMASGASQSVDLTYSNVSDTIYLQYSTTNSSAFECSWGKWSGTRIPLTIKGKNPGTGKVTVYLKRSSNNEILASTTISVTVSGLTIKDVGFGFHNYSKPNISYNICKYMFGNTNKAYSVYLSDLGNGGCCFGFASGGTLIDVKSNAPYVSSFSGSRSSISKLQKTDKSSSYGLSVTDFIEAMQISQVASTMTRSTGLDSLVSTVKQQTDAGIPVVICVFGNYKGSRAGHAIMAFGYNQVSSTECRIKIYDSNHVNSSTDMEETTLYVRKSSASGSYNSWSYNLWSGLTWGSSVGGSSISYVPYSRILSVWNNRGNLNTNNMNLLSTTENNFSLYDFNGNKVAQYANGSMVYSADGVIEVEKINLTPDGIVNQANMFYAPIDLYTVVDESPEDPIEIMIADDTLSVRLSTDADSFDLCADGGSNVANAILTPGEGSQYSVSLGTLIDGNIEEISIEGIGTGETVSLGLENGELSILGADTAELSIHTLGDSYSIDADCTEVRTISNKVNIDYPAGLNARYYIQPDEGYRIKAVYVDGEDVGPVDEYYFEDIETFHSIRAVFSKNISLCEIQFSESEYRYSGREIEPQILVLDGNAALEEGIDYTVSYENNVETGNAVVYVTALPESNYHGTLSASFEIKEAVFGTPDFTLPTDLRIIEESAFEGTNAKVVLVPDTCESIDQYAFRNSAIERIKVPGNCTIADNAFDGCETVLIFGPSGSLAESYCDTHTNCRFITEPDYTIK